MATHLIFPPCKVVIWDFDGCIFESEKWHFKAYQQIFSQYGVDLPWSSYFREFANVEGGLEKNIARYQLDCSHRELKSQKTKLYNEFVSQGFIKPYPQIFSIFREFRRLNIKIMIASNSNVEQIEFLLRQAELQALVSMVTGADETLRRKPHPDVYLKALELSGLNKTEDVLVIEDTEIGMAAAEAAKLPILWLQTQENKSLESRHLYKLRWSHEEVLQALKNTGIL